MNLETTISAESPSDDEALKPICVDLDGTLVRSDTLIESLLKTIGRPWEWGALLRGLPFSRARLKQLLALNLPEARLLPYEEELVEYLHAARQRGHHLVLATAADRAVAERVNAHLQLFDEVLASDGRTNLKGATKAAALVQRFGERKFRYVGNDRSDLPVWQHADAAVLVNASAGVARAASRVTRVERRIERRRAWPRTVLRAVRPHQWAKNFLVFVPLITANAFQEYASVANAAMMFLAFCLAASGVYLVNDVTDLDADRQHPRKRLRPFASGDLPLGVGMILALALLLVGGTLGAKIGFFYVIALYVGCSLGYSLKLKELPLVDVFALAGLYTLRVFGGGEASQHRLSPWLLGFSVFLFLSLAVLKRVSELRALPASSTDSVGRRGYRSGDVGVLQSIGIGSSFVAAAVLALFVQSDWVAARYAKPELLWATVPLVLFWQCRLWLATGRRYMHDDPIVYAASDWVSWLTGAAVVAIFLLARTERWLDAGVSLFR